MLPLAPPRRIAIIGPSSSGKTTLGKRLSAMSGIPYVELDALHWEPNWTPAQPDVFRARVTEALDRPDWIVDGNYRVVRDLTWGRADLAIWLDFPLSLVLWRLTRRTMRRVFRREELWNGNREALHMHLLSRDSLYVWVLTTHRRHRRQYPAQLADIPGLTVARMRSPKQLEAYLRRLAPLLRPGTAPR